MKVEDLLEDAKHAERDVERGLHNQKKSPLWSIVRIVLIFLIALWILSFYAGKSDPAPRNIPGLEIVDFAWSGTAKEQPNSNADFVSFIDATSPEIKRVADIIATQSCTSGAQVCQAKAVYQFVRDNFDYVRDPASFEYVKTPQESLTIPGGDCDDAAILLSSLLGAIGVRTRLVFIPSHVYVEAIMPEAAKRYKQSSGWIALDATCKTCAFGEIPSHDLRAEKTFVAVS